MFLDICIVVFLNPRGGLRLLHPLRRLRLCLKHCLLHLLQLCCLRRRQHRHPSLRYRRLPLAVFVFVVCVSVVVFVLVVCSLRLALFQHFQPRQASFVSCTTCL